MVFYLLYVLFSPPIKTSVVTKPQNMSGSVTNGVSVGQKDSDVSWCVYYITFLAETQSTPETSLRPSL